jgi:hypothetical protein
MNFRHSAIAAALAFGVTSAAFAGPAIEYVYFYDHAPREALEPFALGSTDYCSGEDICAKSLSFNTLAGGTLTVTGTTSLGGSALVYQDETPDNGGLGVIGHTDAVKRTDWKWKSGVKDKYKVPANVGNAKYGSMVTTTVTPEKWFGDDEIDSGEKLTLHFDKKVSIAGMHFFNGSHKSYVGSETFQLIVDGTVYNHRSLKSYLNTNPTSFLTGQDFTFITENSACKSHDHKGRCTSYGAADFYLGAVKITTAVPEPETYAMLAAGLCLMGVSMRRRNRRA